MNFTIYDGHDYEGAEANAEIMARDLEPVMLP